MSVYQRVICNIPHLWNRKITSFKFVPFLLGYVIVPRKLAIPRFFGESWGSLQCWKWNMGLFHVNLGKFPLPWFHDCGGKSNQQLVKYDHEVWGFINSICGCWLWPRKHPSSHGVFFLQWGPANWAHYISNWKTPPKYGRFFSILDFFDQNYRLVMKYELIHYAAKSLPSFC